MHTKVFHVFDRATEVVYIAMRFGDSKEIDPDSGMTVQWIDIPQSAHVDRLLTFSGYASPQDQYVLLSSNIRGGEGITLKSDAFEMSPTQHHAHDLISQAWNEFPSDGAAINVEPLAICRLEFPEIYKELWTKRELKALSECPLGSRAPADLDMQQRIFFNEGSTQLIEASVTLPLPGAR